MFVTIAGALVAWDVGFEYGAFDLVSYRRIFVVFVVSTVVLVATVFRDGASFSTSMASRVVLSLPLLTWRPTSPIGPRRRHSST